MNMSRTSTGSPDLDDLLGGGLERRAITQFYGEPGSGKSTLCVICAVESLKSGKSVIYIDSEGFSVERYRQVAGEDAEAFSERLFLYEPVDFTHQGFMIGECETILKKHDAGLIILDSVTALYRPEVGAGSEAQRRLGHQLLRLLGYARRYNIPIIVTNQVYMDIVRNLLVGLGGTTLQHLSKVILRIQKENTKRRAILEKHRSQPEGLSIDFEIVKRGIRKI